MVWQALDEQGNVSEPYVIRGSLRKHEYLRECLIKRLLPFIEKYHRKDEVLFWPDLSSVHYANICQDWLKDNGIGYVSREDNPPNLPQA